MKFTYKCIVTYLILTMLLLNSTLPALAYVEAEPEGIHLYQTNDVTQAESTQAFCPLGAGLHGGTRAFLPQFDNLFALISTWSGRLAQLLFDDYVAYKVIANKSVAKIEKMVNYLNGLGIVFDAIAFNLEDFSPSSEFDDPISALLRLRELAEENNVSLLFAPGYLYIRDRTAMVSEMASLVDSWLIQAQYFQFKVADGEMTMAQFRIEVESLVNSIRAGNPDIDIRIQLSTGNIFKGTFSAAEVVEFHDAIADLASDIPGGVFIYDGSDLRSSQIVADIFNMVCNSDGQTTNQSTFNSNPFE